MWNDEIVEETRREREAYAAKFNYDLEVIYHDLKTKEQQSKRKVVSLSSKRPIRFIAPKTTQTVAAR